MYLKKSTTWCSKLSRSKKLVRLKMSCELLFAIAQLHHTIHQAPISVWLDGILLFSVDIASASKYIISLSFTFKQWSWDAKIYQKYRFERFHFKKFPGGMTLDPLGSLGCSLRWLLCSHKLAPLRLSLFRKLAPIQKFVLPPLPVDGKWGLLA